MITLREKYAEIELLKPLTQQIGNSQEISEEFFGRVHRAYDLYLFLSKEHIDVNSSFLFEELPRTEVPSFTHFVHKYGLPASRQQVLNPLLMEWVDAPYKTMLFFNSTTGEFKTTTQVAEENKLSYSYVSMMLSYGYTPENILGGVRPSFPNARKAQTRPRNYFRINNSGLLTLKQVCIDYGLSYNQLYYRMQEASRRGLSAEFILREFLRPILGADVQIQNVFN